MAHPFAGPHHAILVVGVHLLLADSAMSAQQEQHLAAVGGSCPTTVPGWGAFCVFFAR